MRDKTQIIIVDDNPIFLEGIKIFLSMEKDYEIMAVFTSSEVFLERINDFDPDIILLDIEMPEYNGFEIAKKLSTFGIELKLIAITIYYESIYIKQLRKAGFRGFVNKNKISEQLNQVISTVMGGELAFPELPVI
jgi:DNA-binding NarL/FixJ family response regulator